MKERDKVYQDYYGMLKSDVEELLKGKTVKLYNEENYVINIRLVEIEEGMGD